MNKLLNVKGLKEFVKTQDICFGSKLPEQLEAEVKVLIVKAVLRAKSNKRRTVLAKDL